MKTIAVVEDNADNRLLVGAILGELYRVVEYTNGPEALRGMRHEPPDLVLLDVSLPGMDGTELLRHVRADAALRGLPVVVLTAHAMAGDRERYLELGFDDYLPKPIVDENDLLGAVARLLRGR
jgi:two-component system, cell cycle response regulator DivK